MRRGLAAAAGAVLLAHGPAAAHPRLWIVVQTGFRLENGRVTAVSVALRLDELLSATLVAEFDRDRDARFDAAETAALEREAFAGLAELLLRRSFGGAPAEIPAVRIASYSLIVAIGLAMTARAGRRLLRRPAGHGHADEGAFEPDHRNAPGCGCSAHARPGEGGLSALAVGLVPCTGSLLILSWALANDMLAAGLALVAAIALCMAITMGGLGLLSVWTRGFVPDRLAGSRASSLPGGVLELAGAGLVAVVGGLLSASSL